MRKRIVTREQKDAHNHRSKERRGRLIASGLCRECGEEALPGMQYCEACRIKANNRLRKMRRDNPAYTLLRNAMSRAKKLGLPFAITIEDIEVPDLCPVLGIPLIVSDGKLSDNSPTIDQIYPGSGYTTKNIRVISYRANSIKRNATPDEVEKVLVYMQRTMV